MIRTRFLYLLICLLVSVLACEQSASKSTAPESGAATGSFVTTASMVLQDTIPDELESTEVGFRNTNVFISNDLFCVVALVDNQTDDWRKIWIRAEVLDKNGRVLLVGADSSLVVKTFSDAVPPRGATSFFLAIPLSQIKGQPVDCRLAGAGSIRRPPGPILIASEIGGVRAMYADKEDPTKVVEQEYQLQATLENPLNMMALDPRMVILIYGKEDNKLYFAQMIDTDKPNTVFREEREGPLQPQEKRKITCKIFYEMLPQQIKDQLIGRIEVQLYEAR